MYEIVSSGLENIGVSKTIVQVVTAKRQILGLICYVQREDVNASHLAGLVPEVIEKKD